jgi:hypothetical protein
MINLDKISKTLKKIIFLDKTFLQSCACKCKPPFLRDCTCRTELKGLFKRLKEIAGLKIRKIRIILV